MVLKATKRWHGVAVGLALGSTLAGGGALAQAPGTATTQFAAVREAAPAAPATAQPSAESAAVRALIQNSRAALKAGDRAKAEQYAKQAQGLSANLPFWDQDDLNKLLGELAARGAIVARGASGDPATMVKDARKLLEAGKLDEAQALAAEAKANNTAKFGVFDDTPTKVLDDVQKARQKADKAEAVRLMVEARKCYADGKLDDAETKAYRAKRLHGEYGVFDSGERPDKLLAEVQTAKGKLAKTGAPAVASASAAKTPAAAAQAPAAPAPVWPESKPVPAPSPIVPVQATAPMMGGSKAEAMTLIAQGKMCQASGQYVEARGKYAEAVKVRAEFGMDEESPAKCLNDLALAVQGQIGAACRDCTDPAKLAQVRQTAMSFGLDTQAIDARAAALAGAAKSTADATASAGLMLLEKARLELARGQYDAARQLATEAHNGNYGVQGQAASVLRSVDAEEHNGKIVAATKGCDAGLAAFRNRDFTTAKQVFAQVDSGLLPGDKRVQMKEAMVGISQMEMMAQAAQTMAVAPPVGHTPPAPISATPMPVMPMPAMPIPVAQAPAPAMQPLTPTVLPVAGRAPAPAPISAGGESLVDQQRAMQQIEFQRLKEDGLKALNAAKAQFDRGETDAAIDTLTAYNAKVSKTPLGAAEVSLLQRPITHRLDLFRSIKAQKDFENRVVNKKSAHDSQMTREALATERKQAQVKELLAKHAVLFKEGKYKEAELMAMKAQELDPDDPAPKAAVQTARNQFNVVKYEQLKERKERIFVDALDHAEDPGPSVDTNNPLAIDKVRMQTAKLRGSGVTQLHTRGMSSGQMQEIERKLSTPVELNFSNTPLRQAIDDLRVMTAMNIVPDVAGLSEANVSLDTPITLKLDNVSLKSALNLLLSQVRLTYDIKDEVVMVTTEQRKKGQLVRKVYSVADLVIPVDDYALPNSANLHRTLDRIAEQQGLKVGGATPFSNGKFMMQNPEAVGNASNGSSMATVQQTNHTQGASMSTGHGRANSTMSYTANVTPTKVTMEETLMRLITNSVNPSSWSDMGGAGTVEYMPIGMALVINQTVDVQEQVLDLLEALRRLQDLEVSVEVRMITLAETFFERIGLDFNVNLKTDKNTSKFEPQLVTGQFKPAGQVNDFNPSRFVSGLQPDGSFTKDLDIPLKSSSFQYAIPPFAYPNNPGMDGGLSLGLAFLSDIQVYMFMEAAAGDRRTNVMQAPKLTLFNGQTASISVSDQQFFVTNVVVTNFGGQTVFVPQNTPFNLGVNLTMQAVVSADRRFVRLNLNPILTNLASATVPLFPVTTFITPVFEGGAQGQPIPFTQFIQQPQFSTVNIQTSVSIPDGGTVILGGLKTLSEGRNEFGPPVLSKLPYVNRLFKNTGYGREAQSLLMMVTPRIIINSEEEEKQIKEQAP